MAPKKVSEREQELQLRIDELEKANEQLAMDLEWQKLSEQKLMAALALYTKGKKASRRGTQLVRKAGTAKSNGGTQAMLRDAFGSKPGTQGAALNSYIIPLIEAGKYSEIDPGKLAAMSGGQFSKARFADHLRWLKKHNYL